MNPYIVSRPANEIQVQKLGDTVRLNCSAGGSPLPKIIWLTDGRIVHSLVEHYNEKNATADTSLSMFFFCITEVES